YKPADIGESCRSSRSSHGGDANCGKCLPRFRQNSIESHVLEEIKKLNLRIDEISRSRSHSRNRNLPFHKRLRRIFQWTFLVGNVSTPIIGADFLYNFRLVPDINDILVASSSPEEHLQRTNFESEYGTLKPSKCIFGVTSIKFLGVD
ncbi:hypothetical protein TNCV_18451, partial [Trichonephila clavipes]